MATLTVWKFGAPTGAADTLDKLEALQRQELITIRDASVVSWPSDRTKPVTRQMHDTVASGALIGTFWGLLFGLIFLVPLLGAVIGAGTGALAGSLADVGIDDDFVKTIRENVTPGTSALFVLTSDVVEDRVREAFEGTHTELIASNLSAEQEERLRHMAEDEGALG